MKKLIWITLFVIILAALLISWYLVNQNKKLNEQTLIGYQLAECISLAPILENSTRIDSNSCSQFNLSNEYYVIMKGHRDRNINSVPEVAGCFKTYLEDKDGLKVQACLKTNLPILKERWGIK